MRAGVGRRLRGREEHPLGGFIIGQVRQPGRGLEGGRLRGLRS